MDLELLQEQNLSQIQIQTLNFLTMSNAELEQYVEKKAEDNPLIKIKSKSAIYETEYVSAYAQQKSDNWDQFYQSLEDNRKSLGDVLLEQFHLLKLSDIERKIGDIIIHSLDKNGFLCVDKDILLEKIDDKNKDKIYYKMCDTISSLEPAGCACAGVYESLKKQFLINNPTLNEYDMLCLSLINKEDFESFSKGNLNQLSKTNKTDKSQIQKAFERIKALNPYPGLSYNIGYDKYIEPDVIVKDNDSGGLDIEIDSAIICDIESDKEFQINSKEDKKTLSAFKNDANNLLSLLNLRNESLAKISIYIIKTQQNYLTGKDATKKALSLKDISEHTALSLSTVSRIINCHWADYKGKKFSLRSLLEQKTLEDNTQDYIEEKIKQIIKESDKKLSDEKISQKLNEKYGIKIARRTVQKYRTRLNISSSYIRE